MIIDVDEAAAIALALLGEKIHNWQKTVPPSWPSTWPVFNRLIERHDEMALVYREIASSNLSRQQFWILIEQIIHAGSFGTDERFATVVNYGLKMSHSYALKVRHFKTGF